MSEASDFQWPTTPDKSLLSQLIDGHAHPTDSSTFEEDLDATASIALDKVCAMASNLGDQERVEKLYAAHPEKIIPAFGLHPWWSHHLTLKDTAPSKEEHYKSLFPIPEMDDAFIEHLPTPTPLSQVLSALRNRLEAHPSAILGEVGLDKSVRLPDPTYNPKHRREAQDGDHRKLTKIKIPLEHQLAVLEPQIDLAFELGRSISFHAVTAQMPTINLLKRVNTKWKGRSRSRMCLHSFQGSAETIKDIQKRHANVFFSFSTTINLRTPRLQDLISHVDDHKLLIESDINTIRANDARIWEILGVVCEAKSWKPEEAVQQLRKNWLDFYEGNR